MRAALRSRAKRRRSSRGAISTSCWFTCRAAPTLWLAAALGARARTELLTLEPDAPPSEPALEKAAALTFELWDERGVYVPATVVRLVELKTRPGITVFVEFGRSMSSVPA